MIHSIAVPYWPEKELGRSYNYHMRHFSGDWICFQDHDVLQVNPNWFRMACKAVAKAGKEAGMITCVTNAIAQGLQLRMDAPSDHNVVSHMRFAKKVEQEKGWEPKEVTRQPNNQFSGFFFITHKKAWLDVGGFKNGFLGVDNYYHADVEHRGYKSYVIEGLYAYHMYRTKAEWRSL
jgi:GT2 family glycosyltransferase